MKEKTFRVRTSEREQILLITRETDAALSGLTSGDGICTIIVLHTTCAISVNENADPDVPADLTRALRALVDLISPKVRFDHGEGNSDAHLLSMMIGCSLTWPYRNGKLVMGRWQGVYFVELDGPREREVTVYVAAPEAP